jgi:hypothetical protein
MHPRAYRASWRIYCSHPWRRTPTKRSLSRPNISRADDGCRHAVGRSIHHHLRANMSLSSRPNGAPPYGKDCPAKGRRTKVAAAASAAAAVPLAQRPSATVSDLPASPRLQLLDQTNHHLGLRSRPRCERDIAHRRHRHPGDRLYLPSADRIDSASCVVGCRRAVI